MIRNFIEGQEIKILQCLQNNNATTDSKLKENGLTPTDLAGFGLNKTQVLKNISNLKTKQLVIGQRLMKKTRPGNYYAITTLGTILLFKYRLENKTDVEQQNELEKIQEYYPLITKYWCSDLVEFDELRHKSLKNAIDNVDIKSREKHYISFLITLPAERNFITFEKTYSLVTAEKEEGDRMRQSIESKEVKRYMIHELEKDLKNLVVFLFYYYLIYEPKKTLKLIKKLKEGIEKKVIERKDYNQKLIMEAKKLNKDFGYNFDVTKPETLEKEIINVLKNTNNLADSIIRKDKDLLKLINKYKSEIRDISNSAFSLL